MGKQIHIVIDEKTYDNFCKALSITGTTKKAFVKNAIDSFIYKFSDETGNVNAKKGFLRQMDGVDPKTQKVIYSSPKPCVILNEHPHMKDYVTVYCDGSYMNVPKEHVTKNRSEEPIC